MADFGFPTASEAIPLLAEVRRAHEQAREVLFLTTSEVKWGEAHNAAIVALRRELQRALARLDRVPTWGTT